MSEKVYVATLSEFSWEVGKPIRAFRDEKAAWAWINSDEADELDQHWPHSGWDVTLVEVF